jgi:hypothetical protein
MTELAALPTLDERLMQRGGDPELVAAEYLHVIRDAIDNHPRSLQKTLGPSEVGNPCARRLGYKLLDVETVNRNDDTPWLPTIGTGVHSWLEDTFREANRDKDTRWLVEMRVDVGDGIEGHLDLYDRVTATIYDHKIVGPTQLRKYKASGPGQEYRTQIHLYGRGLTRRGLPVDTVSIAFLPRNSELRDAYIWSESYDEQMALDGLKRLTGITLTVEALGTAALEQLPTEDAYCHRCPWFSAGSTDLSTGCPGHVGRALRPDPITALIA